jgi:hypothetical protein
VRERESYKKATTVPLLVKKFLIERNERFSKACCQFCNKQNKTQTNGQKPRLGKKRKNKRQTWKKASPEECCVHVSV